MQAATTYAGNGNDHLRDQFLASGDAFAVIEQRTTRVEAAVIGAWSEYLAPAYPSGLSVLAVGGFGRRDLFPHSDVDVLILLASGTPPFLTPPRVIGASSNSS